MVQDGTLIGDRMDRSTLVPRVVLLTKLDLATKIVKDNPLVYGKWVKVPCDVSN